MAEPNQSPAHGQSGGQDQRFHEAWLDAEGRVFTDLLCVGCGYNLRTLTLARACPECGTLVVESARGDYLRYAPPAWVRGLADGVARFTFGGMALVFMGVLTLFSRRDIRIFSGFCAMLSAVIVLHGVLLLTRRDPRPRWRAEGWTARRLLRGALALTLILMALGGVSLFWLPGRFGKFFWLLAFVLATVVLPALLMRQFRALLRRVPAHDLAESAEGMFWLIVFLGTPAAATGIPAARLVSGELAILCVVFLAGAYLALSFLFFLPDAHRVLRRAAADAEAHAREADLKSKLRV